MGSDSSNCKGGIIDISLGILGYPSASDLNFSYSGLKENYTSLKLPNLLYRISVSFWGSGDFWFEIILFCCWTYLLGEGSVSLDNSKSSSRTL